MLAAVETWVKRDHEAEWKRWTGWLEEIAAKVKTVNGVTTEITQPEGLSNKTPSLRIRWRRDQIPVGGDVVTRTLFEGQPRITLAGGGGGGGDQGMTGVSVTPYMMHPGDAAIVGEALRAVLAQPPKAAATAPAPPAADVSGGWDVQIKYAASTSTHRLQLRQRAGEIDGSHKGDFATRDLAGSIDGGAVRLRSAISEEGGDAISFTFEGTVAGDQMSGTLDMGEYLKASWTATRRVAGRRRG
jgi:L-seryl-tRNA(Ser) seleniumtransferase